MRYLPIHVDLKDARVLIVGGGEAAEAKLRTLIKTDGQLILVSPEVSPEIKRWIEAGKITWEARDYVQTDLEGKRLIYAATDDDAVNGKISQQARELGLLVNAADYKDACDFITPALVDRAPVAISIGTEGKSPGLARAIKADLETRLPAELGAYALLVNKLRAKVKAVMPDLAARQRFWADIFGSKDLTAQLRLSDSALTQAVNDKLAGADSSGGGMVSLVGAGPGDPDLITHQARQKLHSADVVIYDRLVSQGVLDFGRREAEYIFVGKIPYSKCGGAKSTPQSVINALIVEKAKQGLSVVRLKGGDSVVFARADEEIEACEQAGIPYELCPGITTASAAAAAIGQSLTARGTNKSIIYMTGHGADGYAEQDWAYLAKPKARAAIYMGIGAARFIQIRLMSYGAEGTRPVTIIENVSRPDQVIINSCLADFPDDITSSGLKGPAILMIGYDSANALARQSNPNANPQREAS